MLQKIKLLNDPVDFIKKNPSMYLGSSEVSGDILAGLIVEDADLLDCGAVNSCVIEGWYIISAEADWIKKNSQNIADWAEVFKKIISLPEAGVNAIRHEILLMAFANSIFISEGGNVVLLKGNFPPEEVLDCFEKEGIDKKFSVGFSV